MKTTIIVAAIVLLTAAAATANAMQYRGTFETEWRTLFEPATGTVDVEATSDGTNFRFDSMQFSFTGALQRVEDGTSLDPFIISVNLFSEDQPLVYIPSTQIASISPVALGWDVQYDGVFRDGGDFFVIDESFVAGVGRNNSDALFDFSVPGEVFIQFDTAGGWVMPSFHIGPASGVGAAMPIPASFTLVAIPEPTTCGLAVAAVVFFAAGRHRPH